MNGRLTDSRQTIRNRRHDAIGSRNAADAQNEVVACSWLQVTQRDTLITDSALSDGRVSPIGVERNLIRAVLQNRDRRIKVFVDRAHPDCGRIAEGFIWNDQERHAWTRRICELTTVVAELGEFAGNRRLGSDSLFQNGGRTIFRRAANVKFFSNVLIKTKSPS